MRSIKIVLSVFALFLFLIPSLYAPEGILTGDQIRTAAEKIRDTMGLAVTLEYQDWNKTDALAVYHRDTVVYAADELGLNERGKVELMSRIVACDEPANRALDPSFSFEGSAKDRLAGEATFDETKFQKLVKNRLTLEVMQRNQASSFALENVFTRMDLHSSWEAWRAFFDAMVSEEPRFANLSEVAITALQNEGPKKSMVDGFIVAFADMESFNGMHDLLEFAKILQEAKIDFRVDAQMDALRIDAALTYVGEYLWRYFFIENPVLPMEGHRARYITNQNIALELLRTLYSCEDVLQFTEAEKRELRFGILNGIEGFRPYEDILLPELKKALSLELGAMNVYFSKEGFKANLIVDLSKEILKSEAPSLQLLEDIFRRYVDLSTQAVIEGQKGWDIALHAKTLRDIIVEAIAKEFSHTMKKAFLTVFGEPRSNLALIDLHQGLSTKGVRLGELMVHESKRVEAAGRIAARVVSSDYEARAARQTDSRIVNTERRKALEHIARFGTDAEKSQARLELKELNIRATEGFWKRMARRLARK